MGSTVVDVLAAAWQEHQLLRYRPAVGHAAMRAVVSHDGWFAPSSWAVPRVERRAGVMFLPRARVANEPPPWRLWIFTGQRELQAARADGRELGPYSGPLRGVELFGALSSDPDITEVSINPVGELRHGWFLDASVFPCVARWVGALRLESALRPDTSGLQERVVAYPSYVVCVDANTRSPRLLRSKQPERVCLPAFTAPDHAEHFARLLGGGTQSVGITGAQLFALAASLWVDGVALNPDGGSALFIPGHACRELTQLARRIAPASAAS